MVILDIERPGSCSDCPMCHPKGKNEPWDFCCFALMEDVDVEGFDKKRLDNCPIRSHVGMWIINRSVQNRYQCSECGMFSGLDESDVKEGFELGNFCSNCGADMREAQNIVRALTWMDAGQIKELDEKSGNDLSQWFLGIDDYSENYAYGIFEGRKLIGYCSLGYADDCGSLIEGHPLHTHNSLLLSDVYVLKEYRGNGYAMKLCRQAIKQKVQAEPDSDAVFLTLLYDGLSRLYRKLGFEWCDGSKEYAMVKPLSVE